MASVLRTTLDGQTLGCNLSCARIFGYASSEEMTNSPISDRYFHPQDRIAFLAKLQNEKSLTNFEECLRRKDGSKVWLLGSANLVDGKGGACTVIEKTFVDITRRKNAEERFQKAFRCES